MNEPVKLLQVRSIASVATLYREESGKLRWTSTNHGLVVLLDTITKSYEYTPDLPSFVEGLSWVLKTHQIETIWLQAQKRREAPPDGGIY